MTDFELYYWPVPFRGQLIRGILAFAGKTWAEHDSEEIADLMARPAAEQSTPFMGPPVLIDNASGFALSEMPAIAFYLGEKLDLMPPSIEGRARTLKVVNDANDVLDEITLDGGRQMWSGETWRDFMLRLRRWMEIWEATGTRCGLRQDEGTLLGTAAPGVADIVSAVLWSTMTERFPAIEALLRDAAPNIAALARRMTEMPGLKRLAEQARDDYGNTYCGGEIEQSLRKVAL
ncbi:MAG: glutathione S-transferase [Novosphingobium sp.]